MILLHGVLFEVPHEDFYLLVFLIKFAERIAWYSSIFYFNVVSALS